MDSVEANLKSLLDDAKSKCSTAIKGKDLAITQVARLQDKLASLKTQVKEVTAWVETV